MKEIIVSIISLLAGCGVFIAGMNMMSDGLQKNAGGGMKKLLGHISGNRFAGVGVGAAVTAIIQSSSATTVMVIGFVNAGVMTLVQATAIIMGANIGTTVTGIIVSLSSLDISLYATLLAFIGVMMTFLKNEKVKLIGSTLCGLGLLFVGLDAMSGAFGNASIKEFFRGIFVKVDFPLLLILIGAVFTGLIQSSSAATGLVIIMVGQGAITVQNALFIVLGCNIGTCVTALLASIGTTVNAKRAALIHLTFNIIGTIIFTVILWVFISPITSLLSTFASTVEMQIAWFHVVFNATTTLVLIPFVNQLVKFATFVIKDKRVDAPERHLKFVDERLLKTPTAALMQTKREIDNMAELVKGNLEKSFEGLCTQTNEFEKKVYETEEEVDFINQAVTQYLIKLSPLVDNASEWTVGSYFHVLNDLERIGDHAENFQEIGTEMKDAGLRFTDEAVEEIRGMIAKVMEMFEISARALFDGSSSRLARLTELEAEVDGLKKQLLKKHYTRLSEGKCRVELSPYYSSTITGLERVADHLVNVGYSVVNPVGEEM